MWRLLPLVVACRFVPGAAPSGDADPTDVGVVDGAVDAPPDAVMVDAMPAFCPADTHLRLCFSFDQATLPASLPNEGAVTVSAQLTNVTRIAQGAGGAAQIDATSTIFVPMAAGVTNIQAIEIWYRADSQPANNARMGLVDSNVVPPNISLFFYRVDPGYQLRCGLGSQTTVWDVATLPLGAWVHAACVCDGDSLRMYVDGTLVGDTAGACATGGAFVADGFTIGSNNNGGPTGVNDWLVGAIDGVRLWDVPVVPPAPM